MRNVWKLNGIMVTIVWLVLLAPAALWAQNSGSINGLVKDASGALIPGATVTVTEQSTNASINVNSQNDGAYMVPNLPPGLYTVAGEAKGFKRLVVSGLNLDAGTNLTRDLALEVGATTTSISVVGSASLVETTSNMQGTTIDATHMLELPLADREINGLINLTPGVSFLRIGDDVGLNRGSGMAGPGMKQTDMIPMIDGVDNTAGDGNITNGNGYTEINPPPDDLQEFRLETNNLTAAFSHGALVLVNAVTKSGGNEYHGDVYAFFRNSVADAAGWQPPTFVKPRLQQGYPGGTFGGPIRKNKTFFFIGYEYLFQNIGQVNTNSLGLVPWRTGDFRTATAQETVNGSPAAVVVPIYDPATNDTTQISCNGVLNVICPNRINPVAVNFFTHIPAPNTTPANPYNNATNFIENPVNETTRGFYMGRVDEQINANNKLYLRYIYTPQETIGYSGSGGNSAFIGWHGGADVIRNTQNYALGFTHLFSPTFFLDAQFGIQRAYLLNGTLYPNTTTDWGEKILGLGANAAYPNDNIDFTGGTVPFDSITSAASRFQSMTLPIYSADFTKIHDHHTFKFGGQVETYNNNFDFFLGGAFTFNGTYTSAYNANGTPVANTGIPLADLELGQFVSYSASSTPSYGLRYQRYAGYVQDDWRVRPNLTLNLGLRYETQNPFYSPTGKVFGFNPYVPNPGAGNGSIPAGAMGETTFQGLNGEGKYLINWRKSDGFEPRFGFAYRFKGSSSTVVRGGFGLIWNNTYFSGAQEALGFASAASYSYTANTNPSPLLGPSVIPASALALPPKTDLTPTFGDIGTAFPQSSITFWDPLRKNPYSMEFNLGVQHQWKNILFEIGYVGTFARHVPVTYNLNLVPQNLLSETSVPLALRRPFTEFTGMNSVVNEDGHTVGVSDYNGLMFRTERRYANGISWSTALTWSKWIDNMDSYGSGFTTAADQPGLQNIYNLRGERALSDSDVPLRFVFSPIVELPFGKDRHWVNQGGVVNGFVGGWQMALMSILQTGSPFGPTVNAGGTNVEGDPNQTVRPNVVPGCNPKSGNKWQPAAGGIRGIQYLNSACFTTPAQYTYGDQPRELSNVLGPGIAQFNLSASKNFYVKERYRLQVRVEAVDVFNTPTFSIPAETLNAGNFGLITGSDGFTRRIMDFGMKFYF